MTKRKESGAARKNPKTRRILTLETLEKHGACRHSVEKFKKEFGDKVTITKKICEKYFAEFDFSWAAAELLSKHGYIKHNNAMHPIWHSKHETTLEAYNDYADGKIKLEEYSRIRDEQWDKSRKALAVSFAECYINDGA